MPQPDPWIGRLIASVRRHGVPVIFGERPHPQRPVSINLASGVVVDLGRGPFLITASHVINRAREREDESRFHFLVGQSEIPFTLRIVSDSATLDVATLTLTRDEASEIEKLGYPIVQPPSWPPPDVNPGADVIAAGFTAHGRSSISWDESRPLRGNGAGIRELGRGGSVHDVSRSKIYLSAA